MEAGDQETDITLTATVGADSVSVIFTVVRATFSFDGRTIFLYPLHR